MIKQNQCFKASSCFYCILWVTKETQWKLTTCIISPVMHSKSCFIVKNRACSSKKLSFSSLFQGGGQREQTVRRPACQCWRREKKKKEGRKAAPLYFILTQRYSGLTSLYFWSCITLKILFLFLEILSFISHCMSTLSSKSAEMWGGIAAHPQLSWLWVLQAPQASAAWIPSRQL